ncbi:siderophore ABC transporter substrate-binding protein [Janthinobacterium sp. J1-1]|uniref:siderophore ABC transporter substrate-binding protein n=1 Tax=Janthinobacterium sp. J1-1 TaxID=3065910 RepID=UPI0035AFB718
MMNFAAHTKRRSLGMLLAGALALAVLPAQAQETRKISHAKGETVIPAAPKSVLVFDLATLDTLQALGVDVKGVPTVKMPAHLAQYADAKYVKIGSLFEPDLEAVHGARPDLIITGGRSAAKYAELAKIAPTIDLTVDAKNFLPSVYRNAETLGTIFGKPAQAQAQALVRQNQDAIAALKTVAAKGGKGLMILTNGGKMSAYGPGSRFGVLHDGFGIVPAQTNLAQSNHGQAISFEFLLQTNPDWLFVLDRDAAIGREGSAAQRLLDNELVRKTTAWNKKQVVYLDAANWYLLGSAGQGALRANIAQISKAMGAAAPAAPATAAK